MSSVLILLLASALFTKTSSFGTKCRLKESDDAMKISSLPRTNEAVPRDLKMVFVGDQGINDNSYTVLKMIRDWNPDGIVQLGDFDYEDNPQAFMNMYDSTIPKHIPVFPVVGNHDIVRWETYSKLFKKRLELSGALANCEGDLGINMQCNFKGLNLLLSGIGTMGRNHASFLNKTLTEAEDKGWNICCWHKNQRLYQTGDKQDETGYEVYDTCRRHGAMIFTAHQHLYARTKLMEGFETQVIAERKYYPQDYAGSTFVKRDFLDDEETIDVFRHHKNRKNKKVLKKNLYTKSTPRVSDNGSFDLLNLSPGFSFVTLSGLGGNSIRPWQDGLQLKEWWSANAAEDNNAQYGAVFCTFNINNDENLAKCEFIDINGKLWDKFYVNASKGRRDSFSSFSKNSAYRALNLNNAPQSNELNFPQIKLPDDTNSKTRFLEVSIDSKHDIITFEKRQETISILSIKDIDHAILKFPLAQKVGKSLNHNNSNSSLIHALHFKNLKLFNGERILKSHLQLMLSRPTNGGKNWKDSSLGIKIKVAGDEEEIIIDGDKEDWDVGEVWVSRDLSSIVNKVVKLQRFQDEELEFSVKLLIEGWTISKNAKGEHLVESRGVNGIGDDELSLCTSPTLAVILEKQS
ncbi:hypothetical protein HDU92_007156 [Lobulomyces angularis]|nr:hypothetical protein HDU92_007156 [Lobulomyces angularis]